MNISKHMNCRRWVRDILCALLIALIPATSVLGLPKGYREDYNGCSSQKDQEKRETCCDDVARDCREVCSNSYNDGKIGPGGWIVCGSDCDDANDSCKEGSTVKAGVDWPGQPGLQIPGIYTDNNRIVSEEGIGLSISTRLTVIEIHSDEAKRGLSACAAVVATCKCPPNVLDYDTVGKECRVVVTAGVVECRICSTGNSSEACKPCDACAPVILSVWPCANVKPSR
jgi:hypothetical protein